MWHPWMTITLMASSTLAGRQLLMVQLKAMARNTCPRKLKNLSSNLSLRLERQGLIIYTKRWFWLETVT